MLPNSGKHHITLDHPTSKKLTKTFTAQVSAIEAMVSAWAPDLYRNNTTIVLNKWPLNKQSLAALQGLPKGPTVYGSLEIELCTCTWPLKPAQYKQLAKHVPAEYGVWWLGQAPEAVVDSICAGLNECRAGKGLPRVKLVWLGHNPYETRQVGECVSVGHWSWAI